MARKNEGKKKNLPPPPPPLKEKGGGVEGLTVNVRLITYVSIYSILISVSWLPYLRTVCDVWYESVCRSVDCG